jgi:hypothetical protein
MKSIGQRILRTGGWFLVGGFCCGITAVMGFAVGVKYAQAVLGFNAGFDAHVFNIVTNITSISVVPLILGLWMLWQARRIERGQGLGGLLGHFQSGIKAGLTEWRKTVHGVREARKQRENRKALLDAWRKR